MELSTKFLRQRLEPFLSELAHLNYRHRAGLSSSYPLRELYAQHPELGRPESFSMVKEALDKRALEEGERRSLRILLEFLADQIEEAQAAGAREEIAALESGAQVAVATGTFTFRDALASLPREESRARRDAMEKAISNLLLQNQGPYARRVEAAQETATRLGHASWSELRASVTGLDPAPLLKECEQVLGATEDAYRDVLGYALRKLDPELKPRPSGSARWHDLLRIGTAPWLAEQFQRDDLVPSITRCLEEMGFHPSANGRIQLDADDRSGRCPGAFVADIKVPDDIRLVLRTGRGLADFASLLHAFGRAMNLAHLSKAASVEARFLADASVGRAWSLLFEHFLIDEAWHRRFMGLPSTLARDAARLSAFNALVELRRLCAQLPWELELYARGPSRDRTEDFAEQQTAALFAAVPKGLSLREVEPQLSVLRTLRAWALETRLHALLQDRFDQDFWRNPGTGRWLAEWFDRGQQFDAEALSKELTGQPLSLTTVAQRLVTVLNR